MKKMRMILFLAVLLTGAPAFADTVDVKVNGLVCDFCARTLTKYFMKKPEVEKVDVNLDNKLIKISFKDGKKLSDQTIKDGVVESGFNVEKITHEAN